MPEIRLETELAATPPVVWADIKHLDTHVHWMHDAEKITFTSATHEGVGTTLDCITKIGPIRVNDKLEVMEWVPDQRMVVRHVGVVVGQGVFDLTPVGDEKTRFTWIETLRFPWWMGGPIAGFVGKPFMVRVWRRNLALLRARFD